LWKNSLKIAQVMHLLIDSNELEEIRNEARQVSKV
jgi:hypothetical protein